jgi:uncharacterized protein YcnI
MIPSPVNLSLHLSRSRHPMIVTSGRRARARARRAGLAIALAAGAAVALAPAVAEAHVTVQPTSVPAGGFVRLDVRVPTESDTAYTKQVTLRLPPGFAEASYEPVPGWSVKVAKTKLAKPIQTDDGPVAEQVSTITWTGHGTEGRIPPGAFQDFGLSVQVPGKAGDTLTFKALQTYSDGKVVRWIGPSGSDAPAPSVNVTAAGAASAGGASTPAQSPGANASTSSEAADGSGSDTLAIVALIVGALGLVAGGVALASVRSGRAQGTGTSRVARRSA